MLLFAKSLLRHRRDRGDGTWEWRRGVGPVVIVDRPTNTSGNRSMTWLFRSYFPSDKPHVIRLKTKNFSRNLNNYDYTGCNYSFYRNSFVKVTKKNLVIREILKSLLTTRRVSFSLTPYQFSNTHQYKPNVSRETNLGLPDPNFETLEPVPPLTSRPTP